MNTIWKYMIPNTDKFTLEIPKGAAYLTTREQGGEGHMWWAVDPDEPTEDHTFVIRGTGHELPPHEDKATKIRTFYRGTYMLHGGLIVLHVFEQIPYK